MTIKRVFFSGGALLLAGGFVLSGCSAADTEGGSSDVEGKETFVLVEASGEIAGLAPYANNASASNNAMRPMYEGLVARNLDTNEIEPRLAQSWEMVDDRTWEFRLEDGVTFHDGTPFNAEAVVHSFDQVENNPEASRSSIMEPIAEVTALDDLTVQITTDEPYGPMLDLLSHPQMRIISPEADQNSDINEHGVGTGPFEFVEWAQGDRVTLQAYDDYWRGRPLVNEYIIREVPDYNTALSMMETGEADFVGDVNAPQAERVESMSGADIHKSDGTTVRYMGMNMDREPMNNMEFRRAVSKAIDRDAYIEHIDGLGQRTDSYAGTGTFGYDPSADDKGVAYDPDGAREIIQQNGWVGEDIQLVASNSENSVDIATIIQAALDDLGLNVDLQLYDGATSIERARAGEHDMYIAGYTSWGSSMLFDTLHSLSIGDGSNMAQFSNAEFDAMLDEATATVDEEQRASILEEANLFAMEQMPWVVTRHDMNIVAMSDEAAEVIRLGPTGAAHVQIASNDGED